MRVIRGVTKPVEPHPLDRDLLRSCLLCKHVLGFEQHPPRTKVYVCGNHRVTGVTGNMPVELIDSACKSYEYGQIISRNTAARSCLSGAGCRHLGFGQWEGLTRKCRCGWSGTDMSLDQTRSGCGLFMETPR